MTDRLLEVTAWEEHREAFFLHQYFASFRYFLFNMMTEI